MKYYIKDSSANNGKNYIDANGYNTSEKCNGFDSEEDAKNHCLYTQGEQALSVWAYISKED